jgi:hypothetical protein
MHEGLGNPSSYIGYIIQGGQPITGADPGFEVRGGGHLKKLRRAEGGAKSFGVFRVKNHDFTPNNHIFFNFRRNNTSDQYRQI